ncbi:50S ribosomal protein L10 [Candidatus Phytoplasma pini]|uniref:Large ribosomal subunit protein uL10 n=1 Tax=Candidatus Phytoplasma pini TaxID=267362 RepID=A0A559KJL1_9MOLU|nr:50S ribosomal protein L10 [Candidatus Phytoplasma pini]TVY12297.1 50S ribosomal protein L10 [Candidatus Phytoplasma pini]
MSKNIIAKKQDNVDLLTENIQNSKLMILFEYQGMKVSHLTELRLKLRELDSFIKIYPNNIIKRSFKTITYYDSFKEFLKYPKALTFSTKETFQVIKILGDFAKKNKNFKIVSGVVENKFYYGNIIHDLASLPSKEALLSMLASSMLFVPLTQLAIGLDLLLEKKSNS